jgi:membrane protease YdiL (CAAX protease family)
MTELDGAAGGLRLGDRPTDTSPGYRRAVLLELFGLWLVVLLLIRGVVTLQRAAGLPDWVLSAVPLLFIYGPVALCHLRKADSWAYRLSIPAFRDGATWGAAAALAGKAVALLGLPFFVGYHLYHSLIFGRGPGAGFPEELATLVLYQIFFVAIPEEFFYRGYFQTRLNEAFDRRWLIFGVAMGPGALLANLFFAFGHSVVQFQWWHFATFFPGLLFAWMRERTGGVTAGALFHAACNVGVISLDAWYGVR